MNTATRNATPTTTRTSVFERLAAFSYTHRWRALILWVVVLVGITGASVAAGNAYHNDFSLPGTDSQQAQSVLEEHGSAQADAAVQIVVRATDGIRDGTVEGRVGTMLEKVAGLPSVTDVRSPYEDAAAVSKDGTVGYATVTLDGEAQNVPKEDVRKIIDTAASIEGEGVEAAVGGDAARGAEEAEGGAAEGAGILGALVILVFLFGSLVAASLPVVTALFAVGSSIGLIALASQFADVADFTPPIMMLVGLGVGIDYALLIFSRYRGELLKGAEPERATRAALDAAGRTVFFAGCTVIIALMGLVALGLGSLQGVALAVALTVLVTMAASLTLLPALLGIFGGRIQRQVAKRAAKAQRVEGAGWRRWATGVQRRPWAALVVSLVALGALAAPALDMRLGFADAGNDAESKSSRQAYDMLAEGFGPGFNGPLIVVADGGGTNAADQVRLALEETTGIAAATGPIPTKDASVATVIAFPDSAPQAEETSRLVDRLRDDVFPPLEKSTGVELLVGGPTAATEDFASTVSDRMPLFVAIVVGLSALLLLAVFRSVLIPLKAALLNLVSIGAALGAITLVFQEGWFGVEPGPIEAFIPVMIFAIVFGLSMDYEVFLLSRIHEEWERTKDPQGAVRDGLAATGKVITAAAAIMIVVFSAFLLSPDRMLQQFGLGLAVAILLDAVVIRCLIVPAVMQLLGRSAWWLPAWLRRVLPKVELERH
ncbi:MMPL family transporter [Streptomyces lunaelactis]|uniref:MMPL family transporter n=1 Tax=Streptomyces lunaelactis TaxID=1535768 RepID=UPI0015846AA1|nr:MMPL family transporter [Streptomyces lunaelactis]NUK33681.1 MMPL family transporter [Streptomyces lunaelactis]NUK40076.1 MMPL family transporter [Streptomyces lunaelactis]NUK91410.1 MMPL family transporter [Streptomyces lunaelactis]NUL33590.1 MMPL family transporter [Streptomyces lunaelactis]